MLLGSEYVIPMCEMYRLGELFQLTNSGCIAIRRLTVVRVEFVRPNAFVLVCVLSPQTNAGAPAILRYEFDARSFECRDDCRGYAENAVLSHGHLDPGMQVVTKPFDMSVLAERIQSMIAAD